MKKISSLLFFLLIISKASADCTASFSFAVDGHTINLDGSASTGDVTQWAWYINGDLFSDAGPQTHTIADSGTYTICLIITTASECIDTVCETVNVGQLQGDCEGCFSYSVDGYTINLDGS